MTTITIDTTTTSQRSTGADDDRSATFHQGTSNQSVTSLRDHLHGERIKDLGLTAFAALGVISLLFAAAGVLFHVTPLVLTSGSMAPEMPTGALAVSHRVPAESVSVGDVVSVFDRSGRRVTHRVVATERASDGITELTLKGDANANPDSTPYHVRTVDLVSVSIPGVGRLIAALDSPTVYFALGMIMSWVLLTTFGSGTRTSTATADDIERERE